MLGAVDSGKTTLAMQLSEELLREGASVSLVDADLGQSTLGPPGTVSVRTYQGPGDLKGPGTDDMVFIGSLSPAGDIARVAEAVRRMVEKARGEVVIVDTSGLVSGEAGRALKAEKLRVLKPRHVIALERAGELEHILGEIRGAEVHRLRVSERARRRSGAERAIYRREKFRAYFKGSRVLALAAGNVEFFRGGKPLDASAASLAPGTCVGLESNGETLALGLLEGAGEELLVRTPLATLRGVKRVSVESEPLVEAGLR